MKKIFTCLATAMLFVTSPLSAYESHIVRNDAGRAVFEVRFYEPADGPYAEGENGPLVSPWPWEPHLKQQVLQGMGYLAQVLQPQGDQGLAIVNVGTEPTEANAFGYSPLGNRGTDFRTLMQRHFQGLPVDAEDTAFGAHSIYALGPSNYPPSFRFTQIPLTGYDELVGSTSVHEVAHGLGMANTAEGDDDNERLPRFEDVLGAWAPLLVDDHGRPAKPGQAILCDYCDHPFDPEAFDARADKAMLVGPNIAEVLEGGLPGVPVSMYISQGDYRGIDDNNMSHIELKNSMMSHQTYRNYTAFMEAELAVLQDLGYTIDRRNFFEIGR